MIYIFAGLSALLSLNMFLARSAFTCALSLLGVLICTAGIFAMLGEHFIAAVQLVVYAGAIVVLFVFSIMILNMKKETVDFSWKSPSFYVATAMAFFIFVLGGGILYSYYSFLFFPKGRELNPKTISFLGGNSKVLAHALFSQFYVPFEALSIPLLIAITSAVVLAKRKID
jgi:NADH-quinone oxidoreductase subunit J